MARLDRLKVSVAPLVRPCRDGGVDYGACARSVDFQTESGSQSLRETCECNEHRLPRMSATPELEQRLDETLERARRLKEAAA